MRTLFPMIQPQASEARESLPLYREVAWDFKRNQPIWRGGNPVIVTGADAVLVWAYNALQTPRFRYPIYSWNYGNECDGLIGSAYTEDLKNAEAVRYVRECLMVNPYIEEVKNVSVEFGGDKLSISCRIVTVYGEVSVVV